MEVNDLQSARDLNFRVEHTNIDLCANFYLPSFTRDFSIPKINFPCNSSLNAPPPFILERSDFNHHLEDHYHKKYTSSNCKKTYCKFCAFSEWKLHKLKYAVSDKSYSYIRY